MSRVARADRLPLPFSCCNGGANRNASPRDIGALGGFGAAAAPGLGAPLGELRLLIREDVRSAVRAELQAADLCGPAAAPRPGAGKRGARPRSPSPDGRAGPAVGPAASGPLRRSDTASAGFVPMEVGSLDGHDNSPNCGSSSMALRRWSIDQRRGAYELLVTEEQESFESQAQSALPSMGCCTTTVVRWADTLMALQEPPRTGCFAEFVKGTRFQTFFMFVIAANAAFMVYRVNLDMEIVTSDQDETTSSSVMVDRAFLALYCIEILCKFAVHGLFFFWNEDMSWNWLDFLLIAQALVDAIVPAGEGGSATWMRTIRLLRVAKVLRILRFIKAFSQLTIIVRAILGSLIHLFWSLVVFALLFTIFSLYFVSTVVFHLQSLGADDRQEAQALIDYFGSVQGCMTTLFMAITGGEDWGTFYDSLVPIGMPSAAFLLFIAFAQLALLNIITGIFVEHALKLSRPDVLQQAEEQLRHEKKYATELLNLLSSADQDQSHFISKDDFQALLDNGKLLNYFKFLGMDPTWSKKKLPMLFDRVLEKQQLEQQLEGRDGDCTVVSPQKIVEEVMALRGNAHTTDIMELHEDVLHVQKAQERIQSQLQHVVAHILQTGQEESSELQSDSGTKDLM